MRLLPCGDRALLAEFETLALALSAHSTWSDAARPGIVELVPGARTVLVRIEPAVAGLGAIEQWLTAHPPAEAESSLPSSGPIISVPVSYDGDDLAAVAEAWGCSVEAVATRHAALEWVCAFIGFAPGFGYLVPVGADLPAVPRRATSRPTVPRGVSRPRRRVLRRLPARVSGRLAADRPHRGVAVGIRPRLPRPRHPGHARALRGGARVTAVRVVDPGPLALVHDLGRPGLASLGVSASGAFDRAAHRLANRLVGNDEHAAAIECLLGGLRLALPAGSWFAVTGAWSDAVLVGLPSGGVAGVRRPVEPHTAMRADAAAELHLGTVDHGLRSTVALRGGLAVPAVLGSRSRDTLAGLGPDPLRAGDVLPLGPEPTTPVPVGDLVPVDPPSDGLVELGVRPGPRHEWFTAEAHQLLTATQWTTSARSDRTGVRLEGPALARVPHLVGAELASEGMLRGSIQVSPDGAPTVLGPDHPVTGGYPVIAVIVDASLDLLAQLRPGQAVRLRLVTGHR